ncbi:MULTISPECIES: SDR family NAD(P)-dependent oxidoreductase [unclassified Rhodococcus (in: high G+C Gram-positive bacteria)]|jgi:3-oxoacyl-[acyl-carrier protein] reductase|uniref:SDR family NAD(P)-dependent oxidoreductase n=1 Tax=unclassified Rhodococcus (in: high G+C Gram-positive bacteria) TaxID=192944 RepID=UPI000928A8C4|nr:3-oxoacyl-ACP reductase FabG [Rhodococcus sp. M8]OLL19263.1 beta-ketoacyl-ACP reductase [Rhodococcus sp. M8]QPG43086.1 3-oxoacyl-ACP reductase FabG [Rhodococcus sp. M8]
MVDLNGRVAFVTGAAQGIGAATVMRLARAGADVAVVDMNLDGAEEVASSIRESGGKAIALRCDVSSSEAVNAAVAQTKSELGPVGVLVNNAGVLRDNYLFKMSDDDWDTVIDTHLRGTFNCTRAAQAHMVEQKWGKIVNVSSVAALGNTAQSNYAAAKAGIQGLTKTHALELGKFNINVNSVAPGFVETAMIRATAKAQGVDFEVYKQRAVDRNPMKRVAQPEDIAGAIALLCSDDASMINGQVIYVAGGPRT